MGRKKSRLALREANMTISSAKCGVDARMISIVGRSEEEGSIWTP